jgi:dTDP-4-dehydrorhamnose reductase
MRIVIVGGDGQLGTALQKCLQDVVSLTHATLEITDAARVNDVLSAAQPDCVINAAAYNLVDRAEDEPAAAYAVNALGPRNLAEWCAQHDSVLVHVSSDYVFGGDSTRRTPYAEIDLPAPTSAYAVSKLAGEYFVQSTCAKHFIVRTCGLYGPASTEGKGNFVKTMLRLAAVRKELTIVNDQRCSPSFTADVASAIVKLIQTDHYGLYHATNSGDATWYEFALEIFRLSGVEVAVRPVTSAEYPQKAKRPAYSVLNCGKLADAVHMRLPQWTDGLERYLSLLGRKKP